MQKEVFTAALLSAVSLTAAMTAEQAARDVLRECFAQIGANIEAVRAGDDPEGPHQVRVGLRRLRGALAPVSYTTLTQPTTYYV